jgi:hypothetical protein
MLHQWQIKILLNKIKYILNFELEQRISVMYLKYYVTICCSEIFLKSINMAKNKMVDKSHVLFQ